jgi:hypothetical protein
VPLKRFKIKGPSDRTRSPFKKNQAQEEPWSRRLGCWQEQVQRDGVVGGDWLFTEVAGQFFSNRDFHEN